MASHSSAGPSRRGSGACAASRASYSCVPSCSPGPAVFAVVHVDHHRHAAMLALQQTQRLGDHRRELAVGDQHLGFAVVHLPGQQRRIQACVQRIEHGVERRYRVMRLDHLRRVGQHHADGTASAHTQRAQRGGEPGRALAHLRPAVSPCAVDDSGQVAEDLGAAFDEAHRAQRHEIGGMAVEVVIVDAHRRRSRVGPHLAIRKAPQLDHASAARCGTAGLARLLVAARRSPLAAGSLKEIMGRRAYRSAPM